MTVSEFIADRHQELRELGLCCDCGDAVPDPGSVICEGCKRYRRGHFQIYKRVYFGRGERCLSLKSPKCAQVPNSRKTENRFTMGLIEAEN